MEKNASRLLIVLCGPSGSGKTSLANELLIAFPRLQFSISATTRLPRGHETHGKEYYFLTPESFYHLRDEKQLIEYEEVYAGTWYGTPYSELDRIWDEGGVPLLDIDVYGAMRIKRKFEGKAHIFFIHPVDIANLKSRLTKRATESEADFNTRISKAEQEIELAERCDRIIYNDDFEKARMELIGLCSQILNEIPATTNDR